MKRRVTKHLVYKYKLPVLQSSRTNMRLVGFILGQVLNLNNKLLSLIYLSCNVTLSMMSLSNSMASFV